MSAPELPVGPAPRLDILSDDVLDSIEVLRSRPRSVQRLDGGLTNANFKVTTPAGRFVVRLSPDGTSALPIDRDQEWRNSVRAAEAGVGAPVVCYAPEQHILVVEYLDGVTLTNESFQIAGTIARVAAAVRKLHGAEPFGNEFNMFRIQRQYLSIVTSNGYRIPDGYRDFAPHMARIQSVFARDPVRLVPCNNDLLAGNFIDCGDEIRLIDYEYSGDNDPCFELGNIWGECALSVDQLEELVTGYFGRSVPQKLARAQLQGIVSRYGWTLWGSIQDATSPLDFDFWSWGLERFTAAATLLTSPRFELLLDRAGSPG